MEGAGPAGRNGIHAAVVRLVLEFEEDVCPSHFGAGRCIQALHDSVTTFDKFVDKQFSESKKNISIIFQPRVTIFYKRKENHKSNRHRSFALQIFECERHRWNFEKIIFDRNSIRISSKSPFFKNALFDEILIEFLSKKYLFKISSMALAFKNLQREAPMSVWFMVFFTFIENSNSRLKNYRIFFFDSEIVLSTNLSKVVTESWRGVYAPTCRARLTPAGQGWPRRDYSAEDSRTKVSWAFTDVHKTGPASRHLPISRTICESAESSREWWRNCHLKLTVPSQMYTKPVPIGSICRYRVFFGHLKRREPSQVYTKPVPIAAIFRFRDIPSQPPRMWRT